MIDYPTSMKITIISPNLCRQDGDLFGSGVPYMPVLMAYLCGSLAKAKIQTEVVDAFGAAPKKIRKENGYWIHGLNVNEIINRLNRQIKRNTVIAVYGQSIMSFTQICAIISEVKKEYPDIPLVVLENTQAVTAFSLKATSRELFAAGADFLLSGEADRTLIEFTKSISIKKPDFKIPGLIYRKNGKTIANKIEFIQDLDKFPRPAWELFPVQNYWDLGYSHGPVTGKFLPVLTSRGCPYDCAFCVVPSTNFRRWRFRSAKNIVSEIKYFVEKFCISEVHLEDLNPGMNKFRLQEISKELIKQKINIVWKIIAGTKIEHLGSKETIELMHRSGCRYISISPESGSPRVLKLMNKPFNHQFALQMIEFMNKLGIFSQACFVLGFPGENEHDLTLTKQYIKQLVKNGLDEVALFIMTPIPGSSTFGKLKGYREYSELTFSPKWRTDFVLLSKERFSLYVYFLYCKLLFHPIKILRQIKNVLTKHFETKMEMVLYRTALNFWWQSKALLFLPRTK